VLSFLDADPSIYTVCFTANATAAIKLVAESYAFSANRGLVLSVDNHNSVNGIREYARRARAPIAYLPLNADLRLAHPVATLTRLSPAGRGLFAFPGQSNFSGVRHPLALVRHAKRLGFDVLLDAAALVPSQPLSLRSCPADFIVLSFYKLFGYPTGVGALVVRKDALDRLRRPWFAGGTVTYASVLADTHRLQPSHEGFEDGTPNFLAIAALEPGFQVLERVGMPRLSAHVARLTAMVLDRLTTLRHQDGAPMTVVYGPGAAADRGGTIAFNILDRSGRAIPYADVERRARLGGVSLRGGCFCNPGASERAFGLSAARTASCLEALGRRFTPERMARCADLPVGAVRLSVGLARHEADIARALDIVASFSV
jgi:selenocysteine lyase/cysteine desulfurase